MIERGGETPAVPRRGEPVETKLLRIAGKAGREPQFQFTSLFHLMNEGLLRKCFDRLRKDAAAGIDGVTKAMYAEGLEARLTELVERLQRLAYIPPPVRRRYIPKPGTDKRRPLGIPTLESKLVEAGLVRILEAIYESDFIEDSYGFRPGRSCHDALRALSHTVESGCVNWIVEADIKGFFDNVDHEWLMKFLSHRIGDQRVLRMIKRFLKAGVVTEGRLEISDQGTPQGGCASPLLANVYLHYVLDLWFERRFRSSCTGQARLIRYGDDFVVCFENEADAKCFRAELIERLAQFSLEVEPSKTKVLAFGPEAAARVQAQGRRKPESFDFLGFTHYCSRSRSGQRFRMKRVTAGKRFRAKLAALKAWLKSVRSRTKTRDVWAIFCAKLRGHFAYYGVTDNSLGLARFLYAARRLLQKWLNRRGGRRRLTWEKFLLMERRFPLPQPKITVHLLASW
jgi:group II intron reverse transcriptase/maturase